MPERDTAMARLRCFRQRIADQALRSRRCVPRARKWLSLIGAVAAFGCEMPAYRSKPLTVFMAPSAATATRIGDKVTTPELHSPEGQPQTLSLNLNEAVQRALEADPQIKAGIENIRQAEADLVSAGLLPNPEALSDLLMMPWGQPFRPTRQGGPTQTDVFVSFPIDWFLFGKRAAAIVTAQKGVDVATAHFADLIRQRISGTIAAYYDVLEAQALLDLAKTNLDSYQQLGNNLATMLRVGAVPRMALNRVRLDTFSAQREVRAMDAQFVAAVSRFRSFLGIEEGTPVAAVGTLDVKTPAEPLTADAAFALAQENRPDLIALQRQIAMAEAGVALEESRAFPQVKPAFGYTGQFQHEFDQPNAHSWNVALQMSLPVFDRNQGNIAKARSRKAQAELHLHAQLVSLRAELEQAVKNFQAARDALVIDDPGQLEAASEIRDKMRMAFEYGEVPLIDVFDSQRAYLQTYRLHIASRSNYWHSLYALNAAVGSLVVK